MDEERSPLVTERDNAIMRRLADSMAEWETDDERTPEWQAAVTENANRRRARHGVPPLKEWWEDKPETEIHRRARALGLLRSVR